MGHSTLRSIVWQGKIVGFWEYDPDQHAVVFGCFDPGRNQAKKAIEQTAEEWTVFIRQQLKHGRSFSLDSDDNLRRRVEQIVALTS